MKLSEIKNGESAVIKSVSGHGGFRKRIMEMGFVRGQMVKSVQASPLQDPIKYNVMGYDISLRRSEAEMISVVLEGELNTELDPVASIQSCDSACEHCTLIGCLRRHSKTVRKNEINVALVGNPNCGKTSMFNYISGSKEHVGNYGGVTVDSKTASFNYEGYRINLTDLPGTYSLSAYTPEEIYVRHHLYEQMPDVIINTVVASNLERNLYLTTELIDLNQRSVVALNMYDELQAAGGELDYEHLGAMIGLPFVPTVAKQGKGLHRLLDTVIEVFEEKQKDIRHIHINYGTVIEDEIKDISVELNKAEDLPYQFPVRYWALKLLLADKDAYSLLEGCSSLEDWKEMAAKSQKRIVDAVGMDVESYISDSKYGFVSGALHETLVAGSKDSLKRTRRIDRLVANKWLGFPIFFLLMWVMFMATFWLGGFPQGWLESGFTALGQWATAAWPEGLITDLVVDGVIAGVGGVAAFLPNIVILYLFISLMEESGYMARAAFIMDKVMHAMGLHGKSFIPLVMGFGCNVPAIMATRSIESPTSRLITILVTPFMSCSARIPVYLLMAKIFFPEHAALVMVGLYCLGILVALLTARLLRKTLFKKDDTPFVMELPPYRRPTLNSTLKTMWGRSMSYIKKIGSVVLVASIAIWCLSYFPRMDEDLKEGMTTEQFEEYQNVNSYVGKIGKFIEPVMEPLGLNWRASIALVASVPAKELVVSTFGVLYNEGGESLGDSIAESGDFTPASAAAFLVFLLLFFPCVASIMAVRSETGRNIWAVFTVVYNTSVAWLVAYLVYNIVGWFL